MSKQGFRGVFSRRNERGNVFFTLFGAVAVVGVLGAGIMATMRGPLSTMVEVNRREQAKAELRVAASLLLVNSNDEYVEVTCEGGTLGVDNDGYTEGPPPLSIGSGPGGGDAGLLPSIGASQTDPWGNAYGYCVWDHGPDAAGYNGGCAGYFAGESDTNNIAIAVMSAGPDGVFQTSCADDNAGVNDYVEPDGGGGDDIVEAMTYSQAVSGSGGLWNIKSGFPNVAEIGKDLEVTGALDLTGNTSLTGTLDVTGGTSTFQDVLALTGASGQLQLGERSMVLPNQGTLSTCNAANNGLLRLNTTGVYGIEVCQNGTGWVPAGSVWVTSGSDIYYTAGNVGIGLNNPNDALDVVGTAQITGATTLGNSLAVTGTSALNNDVTITGSTSDNTADALTVRDLAASTIFTVQNDGNVGINNASPTEELDVSGDATVTGGYMIDGNTILYSDATDFPNSVILGKDSGTALKASGAPGDNNTILGAGSGDTIDSGTDNTIVGHGSGNTLDDGAGNILVGQGVDVPTASTSDYVNIGDVIHADTANKRVGIGFADTYDTALFNDALEVNGDMDVSGSGNITTTLDVGGQATFSGAGNGVVVDNDVDIGGNVDVDGDMEADDYTWNGNDFTPATCAAGSFNRWDGSSWACSPDTAGGGGGGGAQTLEETLVAGNDANSETAVDLGGVAIGSGTIAGGFELDVTGEATISGGLAIGSTAFSSGAQTLELDVTGDIGADWYCDAAGNNCFDAATVASGGGGLWTDNTTHITRENIHVIDSGQTSTSASLDGDGTRAFYDPNKGAFRGGVISGGNDAWQNANVGTNSFAWGSNSEASGSGSTALGSGNTASALSSAAIGQNNTASSAGSIALGQNTVASGSVSAAMGFGSQATGPYSVALGASTVASGARSTTMGYSANASGHGAMAIGLTTNTNAPIPSPIVSGDESIGIFMGDQSGVDVTANNTFSLMGGTMAIGSVAASTGGEQDLEFDVLGDVGAAYYCDSAGNNCFQAFEVGGAGSGLWEDASDVIRLKSSAINYASADFVFGSPQLADSGDANHYARVFFDKSKAAFRAGQATGAQWDDANVGTNSIAIGSNGTASGNASIVIGSGTASVGPNFVLGNGTASGIGGAVALGDGSATGIAAVAFPGATVNNAPFSHGVAMGFLANSTGNRSFAMGQNTAASGAGSFAIGNYVTTSGTNSAGLGLGFAAGVNPIVSGANSFGIFMGDQSGIDFASSNTMGVFGGKMVIDPAVAATNIVADTALEVEGTIKIADGGETCDASREGAIRFLSNTYEVCASTAGGWQALITDGTTLWTDNTTHITRENFHILDAGLAAGSTTAGLDGDGNYAFYDPDKAALRFGSVFGGNDAWEDANIGSNSLAFGSNAEASNSNSLAFGQSVTTDGANSFVMGISSSVDDDYGIAMGNTAVSDGQNSIAIGQDTTAGSGAASNAVAIGTNAIASNFYGLALGSQINVTGISAGAIGLGTGAGADPIVSGNNSFGIFMGDQSGVDVSAANTMSIMGGTMAIGSVAASTGGEQNLELDVTGDIGANNYCDADGNNCFVASEVGTGVWEDVSGTGDGPIRSSSGTINYANADFVFGSPQLNDSTDANHDSRMLFDKSSGSFRAGVATGTEFDLRGNQSAAFGSNTIAFGAQSFAAGSGSQAQNAQSIALGNAAIASGSESFATGRSTAASGTVSTAMGRETTASGSYTTALGWNTTADGTASTALGLNADALGDQAFASGYYATASGQSSIALGTQTLAGDGTGGSGAGDYSMAIGLGAPPFVSNYPQVTGDSSLGIFMGDQQNVDITTSNLMALMGGKLMIDPDTTSATNTAPSAALTVDVEGDIGAIQYCDEDGANCFTAASIAGGGGGLWTDNSTHISYQSTHIIKTGQALPAIMDDDGTRMFFYPDKAAFRGGRISGGADAWQDANIGTASFAYGSNAKATGSNSLAFGDTAVASSASAIALGGGTTSSANNSTAIGALTTASGQRSTAMGYGTEAEGFASMAVGLQSSVHVTAPKVSGARSLGIFMDGGVVNANSGIDMTATDTMALIGGDFIVGSYQLDDTGNAAQDYRMFFDRSKGAFRAGRAQGTQWDDGNVGVESLATGINTTASGTYSTALGNNTIASGHSSTAMGNWTTASGNSSLATGGLTIASAGNSTALGREVTASGEYSMGIGLGNPAGAQPIVSGTSSFGIFMGDQSGTDISTANTFSILGNTGGFGINVSTPATQLDVNGTIKMAYGGEACDASREGAIHYDSTADTFYFCADNANGWEAVSLGSGVGEIDDLTDAYTDYAASSNFIVGRTSAAALTAGAQFNTFIGEGAGATTGNSTATTDHNTAVGYQALQSLTSGANNTASGWRSLTSTTTGGWNTANGFNTLRFNTTGNDNTASGAFALQYNTEGNANTANGTAALQSNTEGDANVAIGAESLQANTLGNNNTALGYNALYSNVANSHSVAIGYEAMRYADDTAVAVFTNNTAVGYQALMGSTTASSNTGTNNTALGASALINNESGENNTAVGSSALSANTGGLNNVAVGRSAMIANTGGDNNVAVGTNALDSNLSGSSNIAIGGAALNANQTADNSVAIGRFALASATGARNIALGVGAGYNAGANDTVAGTDNILIGFNVTADTGGATSNYLNIGNVITGDMSTGDIAINGTAALTLPIGDTGNRPGAPANGMIRYNSATDKFEGYQGGLWQDILTGAVAGGASAPDRGIQFNSGGNFAAEANFTYTSTGDLIVGSSQIDDTGTGSEDNRMFFDVSKGAFRAGTVVTTQWDDTNLGNYSAAFGQNSLASGVTSFAAGLGAVASGNWSAAIGQNSEGSADDAIGLGKSARARGNSATAIGNTTLANGVAATAIGSVVTASGVHSIALGREVVAGDGTAGSGAGDNSMAIGLGTAAGVDPRVTGDSSLGIFMGDQSGYDLATSNRMALVGGDFLIDNDGGAGSQGCLRYSGTELEYSDDCSTYTAFSGIGGTPGGADTHVQFNSNGSFAGDTGFTYDAGTDTLTVSSTINAGELVNIGSTTGADAPTGAVNGANSLALDNLTDVDVGGVTDGQLLTYNNTSGNWEASDGANAGLWTAGTGDDIYYNSGTPQVGVGLTDPDVAMDIGGTLQIADGGEACAVALGGAIRYRSGIGVEYCDGTSWKTLSSGGSGIILTISPPSKTDMDVTGPGAPATGATVNFTITNEGDTTTDPLSYSLDNTTNFNVVSDTCTGIALGQNGTCVIGITPQTSGDGLFSATLNIPHHNAPAAILQGTGSGFGCSPGQTGFGGVIVACDYSGVGNHLITMESGCDGTTNNPTCSGADTYTRTWAPGSEYIGPIVQSTTDGAQNTVNLIAYGAPAGTLPAAEYCDAMQHNGETDWFLPSESHLQVAYTNIVSEFEAQHYWSSTERAVNGTVDALRIQMGTGGTSNGNKNGAIRTRCMRVEGVALPSAQTDTTPNTLTFATQFVASAGVSTTSNTETVTGSTPSTAISISGDASAEYSINGGAYTSAAGTVDWDDTVTIRMDSPAAGSRAQADLTIGTETFSFSVITEGDCGGSCAGVDKRVFVSSSAFFNSSDSTASADATCQSLADTALLGGTWKVLASGSAVADYAVHRIDYNWDRLVNMNGDVIADNPDDLWDGTIDNAVLYDENTTAVFGASVRTKSSDDGTYHSDTRYGYSDFATSQWIIVNGAGGNLRAYCMEQNAPTVILTSTPASGTSMNVTGPGAPATGTEVLFTIENTGTGSSGVLSASLAGGLNFTITNDNCTGGTNADGILDPSETCTIGATPQSSADGNYNDTLTITDATNSVDVDISLSGLATGFGALANKWQDGDDAGDIHYSSGPVGVGTSDPDVDFDVAGIMRAIDDAAACTAVERGAIRYNSAGSTMQVCDGTAWGDIGAGGLWTAGTGDDIYYNSGTPQVGVGLTDPDVAMDVGGTLQIADGGETCAVALGGAIRYRSGIGIEYCDGTNWINIAVTGTGVVLTLNPPNKLDMDVTGPGAPASGTNVVFNVTNTGAVTSNVLSYSLTNTTNFNVTNDTCTGNTLAPAASCQIEITPQATGDGTFFGTLSIDQHNNPSAALQGLGSSFGCYAGQRAYGGIVVTCDYAGVGNHLIINDSGCSIDPLAPACTGTGGAPSFLWAGVDFDNEYLGTNVQSSGDGAQNSVNILAYSDGTPVSDFPAASYCDRFNNGQTDWFLPSSQQILDACNALDGDANADVAGNKTFSSTENTTNPLGDHATVLNVGACGLSSHGDNDKFDSNNVRCMRVEGVAIPSAQADTDPDDLTFATKFATTPSTQTTSDTLTVTGITTGVAISISGATAEYQINGGTWGTAAGTVSWGDTVAVRIDSPAANSRVQADLTIGSDTFPFSVITEGDCGGSCAGIDKRIFATSDVYNDGNSFTGNGDADCQALADTEGLGGTWESVISGSSHANSAANTMDYNWDRLVNMNGDVIADDPTDLWDGTIDNPVGYDETGTAISADFTVWTGADANGSYYGSNCNDWSTNSTGQQSRYGRTDISGNGWISAGTSDCSNEDSRLYCVETTIGGITLTSTPSSGSSMNVTGPGAPATGTEVIFTIQNTGTVTSAALSYSLTNSANFQVTTDNCSTNTLAASATCTIGVTPQASADGNYNGTLTVQDTTNSVDVDIGLSGLATGFGALANKWQDGDDAGDIHYSSGPVGVGTTDPDVDFDVAGIMRAIDDAAVCTAVQRGAIRFNSGSGIAELCDGSSWLAVNTGAGGLWTDLGSNTIHYGSANSSKVGVNEGDPLVALDVGGTLKLADGGEACAANLAGALRYQSGNSLEICNGTAWVLMLAQSTSAILSISPTIDTSMDITVAGTPGVSSWQTFTVENLGTITSQIMAVTLSNAENFEVNGGTDTCTGNTLAPAATCSIEVRAKSFVNGSYNGTLTIAADNNPTAVLGGTATGACGTVGASIGGGELAACLGTYKLIVMPSGCADDVDNPACGGADGVTKRWYTTSSNAPTTGASSNTDGPANTSAIAATAASGVFAAGLHCDNMDYGGHTDWYLPAPDEWTDHIYPVKDTLGGFAAAEYWTSRQVDSNSIYDIDMNDGTTFSDVRPNLYRYIRCARRDTDTSGVASLTISPGNRTDVDYTNTLSNPNDITFAVFTITNDGGVTSATLGTALTNATDFAISADTCNGNTLAASASCTVTVRMTPSDDGNYATVLNVTGNNGASANISGTALGTCGRIGATESGGVLASCESGYRLIVQPTGCDDDTSEPSCLNGTDIVSKAAETVAGAGAGTNGTDGPSNTVNLAATGTAPAAQFCSDLVQGTYSDWYLPARDELRFDVYPNNAEIGYSPSNYWSSTEGDSDEDHRVDMSDGTSASSGMNNSYLVRCARRETGAPASTVVLNISPSSQTGMDVTGPGSPATGSNVTFTVSNDGTGTSGTLATSLINSFNFEITTDNCNGNTLAAAANCTIDVRPRAYADGNLYGSLQIDDATNSITELVGLSGTATGWASSTAIWYTGADDDIYYNSGTNPMVGVGMTDPSVELDVAGIMRAIDDSAACTATQRGAIRYHSASNIAQLCDGSSWIAINTGAGGLWTAGTGDDIYYNSGTPNVGIGTATPSHKLDVVGAIQISDNSEACAVAGDVGGIRFSGGAFEICQDHNTGWEPLAGAGGGGACNATETYTTAATHNYTVPASFDTITIKLWGGGGGGGSHGATGKGDDGNNTTINSLSLVADGGVGGDNNGVGGAGGAGGSASGGDTNTNGNNGAAFSGSVGGDGGDAPNGGVGGAGSGGNGGAGSAPGGGGGGASFGGNAGGGGGSGAYVEKVYTPGTLTPSTVISDIVVGAGGNGETGSRDGGAGAVGRISITCVEGASPSTGATFTASLDDTPADYTGAAYKALHVNAAGTGIEFASTGAMILPTGTTAQRPGTPVQGMIRYNSTSDVVEAYVDDGTPAWENLLGGSGTPGGADTQVQYNDGGAFAGDAGFTYAAGTDTLTIGSTINVGDLINIGSTTGAAAPVGAVDAITLDNISDVNTTGVSDGDCLVYNNTSGDWEDGSCAAGGGSLWTAGTGDDIYYNSGTPNVGIGTTSPLVALDVNGTVRVANGGETCDGTIPGAIRYQSDLLSYCDGVSWKYIGEGVSSGGGVATLVAQGAETANTTNFNLDPTALGASVGDTMIVAAVWEDDAAVTGPAGWTTEVDVEHPGSNVTGRYTLHHRTFSGSVPGSQSWSYAGANGVAYAWTIVSGTTGVTASYTDVSGSASTGLRNYTYGTGVDGVVVYSLADGISGTESANYTSGVVSSTYDATPVTGRAALAGFSTFADTAVYTTNAIQRNHMLDIEVRLGGGSGTTNVAAGGFDGSIQFNSGGALAGGSNLMYLPSTTDGVLIKGSTANNDFALTVEHEASDAEYMRMRNTLGNSVFEFDSWNDEPEFRMNDEDGNAFLTMYAYGATGPHMTIRSNTTEADGNSATAVNLLLVSPNNASEDGNGIFFNDISTNNNTAAAVTWYDTNNAANAQGGLKFKTNNDGSGPYTRMTIDEVGNVGIGTTSPGVKLDVVGIMRAIDDAATCNATARGAIRYNSAGSVAQVCDGTSWGNIGSGGGTPGGADTQVQYNDGGSFAGDAGFTYAAGTDTLTIGSTINAGDLVNIGGTTGAATPTTNSGTVSMDINDLGDVNILSASNGECLKFDGSNWVDGSCSGGAGGLWSAGAGDDIYYNSGTPRVGIGTATPTAALHILGGTGSTAALTVIGGERTSGNGTDIVMTAGDAAAGHGGDIILSGGERNHSSGGFASSITIGGGLNYGPGGALSITGGGGDNGHTGGQINITGGAADGNSNGANVVINGGALSGSGADGNVVLANSRGRVGIGTSGPRTSLDIVATDAIVLPGGTDAQRPGTPVQGMIRYNSTSDVVEAYIDDGTPAWESLLGGGGSGLWTDNGTHINYESAHIIKLGQALPASHQGDGFRMFYYQNKAAFRGGRVAGGNDAWQDANIGVNSFAWGYNVQASGGTSVAMGSGTTASGSASVALGQSSNATGEGSVALGWFNNAAYHSVALGDNSDALGNQSVALGKDAIASGIGSVALGFEATAGNGTAGSGFGDYAMAIGLGDPAGAQPQVTGDSSLGIFMGDQSGYDLTTSNRMALVGGDLLIDNDGGAGSQGCLRYSGTQLEYSDDCSTYTAFSGISGTPATPDRGIQFNSGGSFAADANFRYTSTGDFIVGSYQKADTGNVAEDNRMFFDKAKGAFRAGNEDGAWWDDANVGDYSVAMGRGPRATAEGAVALGDAYATHRFATATGYGTASGEWSVALGYSTASGEQAVALGYSTAAGWHSFAVGREADAQVDYGIAIGRQAIAQNQYGVAIGYGARARADASVALGYGAYTDGLRAIAAGDGANAVGDYSVALGHDAVSNGEGSAAMGRSASATGEGSVALGDSNASGLYSFAAAYAGAGGDYATGLSRGDADGYAALATGYWTDASGDYSTAIGREADAGSGTGGDGTGDGSFAIGLQTQGQTTDPRITGDRSMVIFMDGNVADANSGYDFTESDKFAIIGGEFQIDSDSSSAASKGCIRFNDTSDELEYSDDCSTYASFASLASGSGLWTDNTTHISYQSSHIIKTGQTLPATMDDDGTRMFFYPDKGAFRAGAITGGDTAWQDGNIGLNSFAYGQNAEASGSVSIGVGFNATASGELSTALGSYATASGDWGTALGLQSDASGDRATAIGSNITASGGRATAIGANTTASGLRSTALGYEAQAGDGTAGSGFGDYSMAIGLGDASTASLPQVTGDSSLGIFMGDQQGVDVTASNVMSLMGGSLGIGTVSPAYALDVVGDIQMTGILIDASDARLKTDITPLQDFGSATVLERLDEISGYSFRMKDDESGQIEYGVMAQEVERVFPELVKTADDEMGTKSVNYVGLIAPLIEASKELKAENEELKTAMAEKDERMAEIEARMEAFETDMAGLKAHTGFGISKASAGLLMLMLLALGGAMIVLIRRRQA